MNNASAFFGAPPPPASSSQTQSQQQQRSNTNRGAMPMPMHGGNNIGGGGGGSGMHSRPMTMQQSAPPPPRYHQPQQQRYHQQQQQPQFQQQQNNAAPSHYGAPPSSFEEDEAFETLDLNNNSHHPPTTSITTPMTSIMGANTNSNDSSSTSFMVSSSSGPENFSNYSNNPPPTASHQLNQQQQQHDNTYRDDGTFEYEGGVALQTALNVFGSVASAAGGLAGGLLAAGGLSGNNNHTTNNPNARRMGMGIGGGGNLVGNVATWKNRIVDVVAPTTATTNSTNTSISMASNSAVGMTGSAVAWVGGGVGGPSSHRSASPVFPPLPPQQHVPTVVHQHHPQPPPSPMYHQPPTPTMQYRHQQQQHRRQSSVASNNSSEAHELFGAATITSAATTISTTHAAPATTTPTTTTTMMAGHLRQSSTASGGGSVGGSHGIGRDSASDFFASSASSQSMGQQQYQGYGGSAGDFFNAPPTPTQTFNIAPSTQTQTATSATTTTYNNIAPPTPTQTATSITTTTYNTIAPPTPTTATMLNTSTATNDAATTMTTISLPADMSMDNNTLPKEEETKKNERQRQLSHRLSSLEKATHDTSTFQYADPLVGGVGVFAAVNDERGGGGGETDNGGTTNNPSMVVGDVLSDPIPIPAAGEEATSTENVTKSESTIASINNMESAASSSAITQNRQQEPQSPSTMISSTEQSRSVTTTQPVGKILLPTPSKAIATSSAAAATRQHYLPLPPPLPARKKTPFTGEHATVGLFPSGTMEKATTTFRKPPPIPGGGGGSNTSTPRFHVPSPRVSPRLSPMTATDATPPSSAARGVGRRAVAGGGTVVGGGDSTPLVPSLGEGTVSATTSPAVGVPPAPATPVDVRQTPTQHRIGGANNISPLVSVAQGSSVVNFNDDVDWNSVANSMVKEEDAVHKIVATAPPPPPPIPQATVVPSQPTVTAQPIVVAPSPTITQPTAQFSVLPADAPTVIDPSIIYSSTSPPIYPNNQIPRTPSSRVTECDVMSDYQMQVCEEDFPDVMLPSPGSHAGGDANSVVALEDNIMDNGSVSGPSAASMFGIDNGVPPPPQQQQLHAQLPETTPESIVQTPIDADRMSGYRDEVIEDDFGTSQSSNREENIEPLASMINDESPSDVEPPLLPEGWVECLDANTGRVYFYNENAGTSSWERPVVDDVSAGDGDTDAASMDKVEESEVGLPPTAVSDGEVTGDDNIIEYIQPEAETPHLDDVKEIETLPECWEKIVDPTTDKVYYYNSTTGMSSWDCPVAHEQNEQCLETAASDQQEVNEQAVVGHTHLVEIQTDFGDAAVSDVAEATAVSHSTEEEVVEVLNPPSIINGENAVHEATINSESEISAAKEDDPMPEGWIESRDPTTGGIFYYNEILAVSQWHRPTATREKDAVDDVLDGHIVNDAAATVTPTNEAALPQSVTEEEGQNEPPPDEVLDQQLESSSTLLAEHKIDTASMDPSDENEEIAQPTESNTYKEPNGNPEDTTSILSFESLPPGWIEAIDDNTGLTYYYNEESNETSWDRPLANENKINVADATVEEEYIHVSTTGIKHVETHEEVVQDEGILHDTTDADQGSEVQQSENNLEGDWTKVTDPDTGKVYYYNRTTNEASWEKPAQNLPAAPEMSVSEKIAVEDSKEHVSKEYRGIAEPTTVDVVGAKAEEECNDVGTIGTKHVETHEEVIHDDGIVHDTTDADQRSEVQQSENNQEGDWTKVTDPDTGKVYYYNRTTNEASWEKPALNLPAARSSKEAEKAVSGEVAVEVLDSEEPVSEYCEIAGSVEEPTTLVEAIDEGWTRIDNPPSVISEEGVETEESGGYHHEASNDGILPDGWQELIDPTTGKVYYYNEVSGATSWTPPEPPLSEVIEESNERLAEEGESCDRDVTVESAAYPSEVEDKMVDNLAVDEDVGHLEVDMPMERSNVEVSKAAEGPTSEESNGTLLPEGWMQCTDPNSGQTYYFNESTGESSWDRPVQPEDETVGGTTTGTNVTHDTASSVQTKRVVAENNQLSDNVNGSEIVPTHASSDMSLPDGWIKVDDPSSGGTYYYNESSGETTWERPIKKGQTSASLVSSRADHPRPAHAIATFGFGGRLCVMIPQVAATLSGATTVGREYPTTMRRGPVVIHRICDVIPRDHTYSIPSSTTPSSPLVQTKEDEVLSYLKKKSSNPEDLLWRVINIAAQNRGRLRNEKNAHEAIVDLLLASNSEGGAGGGKKQESRLPLESSLTSNLAHVQDLIQRGERESAVDEALSQENFALALLIASMCDRDTYRITARRFADKTLPVGSPLHTVALLFSDNVEIPTDEELLDPYGKRAPKRSLWYDDEVYEDLGQSWKEQLASILCNRTARWENIVLSLGDRLLQLGHCHAAHVCYLVSSSSFGSPSKDTTRLVLIGCDHRSYMNQLLMTPQSIQSFERTEAFEWARRRGNRNTHIPSLQPFKFRYAELLADFGHEELARNYLLSIRSSIGLGSDSRGRTSSGNTTPSVFMKDAKFIEALEKLDDRICGSTGAEHASWDCKEISKGGAKSLALGSMVKNVLRKKSSAGQPVPNQDTGFPILQESDDLSPREPESNMSEPSVPEPSIPRQLTEEPKRPQADIAVESALSGGDEHSISSKKSLDRGGLVVGYGSTALSTNDHQGPPSSAPPVFGGGAIMKNVVEKPEIADEDEREKDIVPPTPPPASKKDDKKKAPVSEPPRSAGWLSKLLGRDGESKATVADVGEEMQAYYDEKLKRWIFPGDDPAEVAKPLAPPPIIPKTPVTPALSAPAPAASNDPLAALMAPPPSRGLSTMKKGTSAASRYADPLASTGKRAGASSAGSTKIPPTSPMMAAPPTFAVFQPKPAPAESS